MELQVAMLCEDAAVERGRLNVTGGATAKILARGFPGHLGLTLAVVLELDALDGPAPHLFRVELVDEDELALAELRTEFALTRELDADEVVVLPAAFPLDGMQLPRAGCYEVRVDIDGVEVRRLALRAVRAPGDDRTGRLVPA